MPSNSQDLRCKDPGNKPCEAEDRPGYRASYGTRLQKLYHPTWQTVYQLHFRATAKRLTYQLHSRAIAKRLAYNTLSRHVPSNMWQLIPFNMLLFMLFS